jgi:hypothetical protein
MLTGYFGFPFVLAIADLPCYKTLRATKRMLFFLVLVCSFVVPFFFAQSYLVGLFLPFQWFIYYLTPPLAVFCRGYRYIPNPKSSRILREASASFRKNWLKQSP